MSDRCCKNCHYWVEFTECELNLKLGKQDHGECMGVPPTPVHLPPDTPWEVKRMVQPVTHGARPRCAHWEGKRE